MTRSPSSLLVLASFLAAAIALAAPGDKPGKTPARGSSAPAGANKEPRPAAPKAKAKSPHRASITKGLDCSTCHTPSSWRLTPSGSSGGGFDHSVTGFPLSGGHRQTACTACHTGDRKITRECVGCHEDSHRRRLGQGCDRCHSSRSFRDVRAIELHRRTRLPLAGMHALVDCSECHQRSAQGQFSGAPADCYACHVSDYRRTDIHPLHVGAAGQPPFPKECATCHRATAWTPAFVPASFQFRLSQSPLAARSHELSFPIRTGKHRGFECGDCHVALEAPRLVRCTGCHNHNPVRIARQHQRLGPVRERCVHCHRGGRAR